MAFKVSMVMAVLATACAAPAPQYYNYAGVPPPPPPPPAVHHRALVPVPPPPPPAVHHHPGYHAAPVFIPIVSQTYDASPDGSYTFQYEAGDGSARQEQGISRSPPGHEGPGGVAVQGRYTYPSEAGAIQVEYIADENGFQPSGNNIHPEIIKAVAAQVAFARSEPPTAYNAPPPPPPPPVYARIAAPPPPVYTAAPPAYPFKA